MTDLNQPAGASVVAVSEILPSEIPTPTAPTTTPAPAAVVPSADSSAEQDAKGVPFDSARHLAKKHPVTGRWMPKGGRKPGHGSAPTPPASSAGSPSNPSLPHSASFIPDAVPPPPVEETDRDSAATPTPAAEVVDVSDDAAECGVCAVVAFASLAFDDDCAPAAAEEKNMKKAVAAWVRAKGWHATAGIGVLLTFSAYLLRLLRRPGPKSKVRAWFGGINAKNVTPTAASGAASSPSRVDPKAPVIDIPPHIPPLAS